MKHVSKPDLIKLASGELDGPERIEAEAHLAACEACRAIYCELSGVRDLLGEWAVDADSRDIWALIERRLDVPSPTMTRTWRQNTTGLPRIAAAILLGIGVGHAAGRLTWTTGAPKTTAFAEASSDERAAAELGLYVFDSPTPAGLFATVQYLTDADAEKELMP